MPTFARIGRLPNLAATLSSGFPYAKDGLIYAPNRDKRVLAALADLLARSAVTAGQLIGAHVTFDAEAAQRGSALFVGALDDLAGAADREIRRRLSAAEGVLDRAERRPAGRCARRRRGAASARLGRGLRPMGGEAATPRPRISRPA